MIRQYHFFNIPIPEASISLGQNGPESCLPASSGSDDGKDAPGSPHIYIYITPSSPIIVVSSTHHTMTVIEIDVVFDFICPVSSTPSAPAFANPRPSGATSANAASTAPSPCTAKPTQAAATTPSPSNGAPFISTPTGTDAVCPSLFL